MSESIFTERQAKLSINYLRQLYSLSKGFRCDSASWQHCLETSREDTDSYWLRLLFRMAESNPGLRGVMWLSSHHLQQEHVLRLNIMDDLIVAYQLSELIGDYSYAIEQRLKYSIVRWGEEHEAIQLHQYSSEQRKADIAAAECKRLYNQLDSHSTMYLKGALRIMRNILQAAYGSVEKSPEIFREIVAGSYPRENILARASALRRQLGIYREASEESYPYEIQSLYQEMLQGRAGQVGYFQLFFELSNAEARYYEAQKAMGRKNFDLP